MRGHLQKANVRTGIRLRQTCKTRGWTLTRFAKRARISRTALYRFLEGQNVALPTAIAISKTAFTMLNETQKVETKKGWGQWPWNANVPQNVQAQ